MAKRPASRVFLRKGGNLCDLFWITMTSDGSVIVATSYRGTQTVHLILEEPGSALRNDVIVEPSSDNPKISFHSSGRYKINSRVGRSSEELDRCTVIGPRLDDIDAPRRMAEVVLPQTLAIATRQVSERDIVLDSNGFPPGDLMCTIWCCSTGQFEDIRRRRQKTVDTSIAEFSRSLEDGKRVWTFTLRVSSEPTRSDSSFYIHLPGRIVWGSSASRESPIAD